MYVELNLDKPRRLRYTINAMRELEKMFGDSLGKLFDPDTAGLDHIVHLVWVGLKHGGDRRVTVDEVGDLLQEHFLDAGKPLTDAMEFVTQGLQLGGFIPKDNEEEADSGQPNPTA